LPEKPTLTLNLISSAVVILTFISTSISTLAPTSLFISTLIFIILMVFAPALAKPTLLLTLKIAAALSPATYILTKP
jgi:hypothetical protein